MAKKVKKKSVTWQDDDRVQAETSETVGESKKPQFVTPHIVLKLYNLPIHLVAILYHLLYVEYDNLVNFNTINVTLLKEVPLLLLGQLFWLTTISVAQSGSSRKKSEKFSMTFALSLAAIFVSFFASFAVYGVCVLLGAPILVFQAQTWLLSVHVSLLTVLPLVAVYEFESKYWYALLQQSGSLSFLAQNPVFVTSLFSALGCWLGVITIPLDWDRDWQLYPISLVVGAYLGGAVGGVLAFVAGFLQ